MKIIADWKRKRIINYLENTDPCQILKKAENKVIPAFFSAARDALAYKKLLREKRVDVHQVKDIESFKKLVPVINKEVFGLYPIKELCKKRGFNRVKTISLSSGFSGTFSYSVNSGKELVDLGAATDFLLDYNFAAGRKKTLLISCLGQGVRIYTNLTLSETSVRPDAVLALIDKFSREFEQFILIGNPFFLKETLEEGVKRGLNWKSKQINLVLGEEWFPEELRSYFAYLLGIDFNQKEGAWIGANMGISELGSSLFQESPETMRIRRLAQQNKELKKALFGEGILPVLFHWNPFQFLLEEIEENLVFTILDKYALMPLVRYNSQDKGRIITYQKLKEILAAFNYQDYLPKMRLPLVAVSGRKDKFIQVGGRFIYPEEIKEGLYSDFKIISSVTGYFRMGREDDKLKLEVQLKKDRQSHPEIEAKIKQAIAQYAKINCQLTVYPYKDFPYGMGLIYEQKFKYI